MDAVWNNPVTVCSHPTYFLFHRTGIVTRCPLELKMKRKKEGEDWYGKISYQDYEEELDDPQKVEAKIREGNLIKPLSERIAYAVSS